jgi:peptidoglycan/LPS O-acetylase OafA/YrhL
MTRRMVEAMSESRTYDTALGYLRSFVTVLVVAHHAALAYHPFAPPPPASLDAFPQWWRAFPVVDGARWSGFQWLVAWNDTFFMALMFLLSGLFVWTSLARKGPARFARDRVIRLGGPWLLAVGVLAPLAYFPAFLESGGHGLGEFWRQWRAAGAWPSGPAWFLAVLLGFDLVAAAVFALGGGRGAWLARLSRRNPIAMFAIVVGLSALAYIPLSLVIGSERWTAWGPIAFQTGRLAHYAVYFVVGVALGAAGLSRGVVAAGAGLARWWPAWVIAAGAAFWLVVQAAERAMITGATPTSAWGLAASAGFVVTCAASSFALLAVFVRFARRPAPILDSLRDSAYGIYVVHYAIVAWLQYALLAAPLPGFAKGALVTTGGLALAWLVSAAVRRAARRYSAPRVLSEASNLV